MEKKLLKNSTMIYDETLGRLETSYLMKGMCKQHAAGIINGELLKAVLRDHEQAQAACSHHFYRPRTGGLGWRNQAMEREMADRWKNSVTVNVEKSSVRSC